MLSAEGEMRNDKRVHLAGKVQRRQRSHAGLVTLASIAHLPVPSGEEEEVVLAPFHGSTTR